ncbi:MAG: PKD domain-containing protein, partial [Chitinivibrionales bacterium]|nr:PKD domain-containing protein [Chitinivibrionales bacterium]MBD3396756.1 PKD domain-containing protein [Chitinivibrionales bacterium]
THAYGKAGKHVARFRVRSDDGSVVTDTVVAEVFNAKPVAEAGKDLSLKVNQESEFAGEGSDPDGEVTKYQWDFNGDGTYDYGSLRSGVVQYAYKKKGSYTARLKITTKDGQTAEDEITVTVTE